MKKPYLFIAIIAIISYTVGCKKDSTLTQSSSLSTQMSTDSSAHDGLIPTPGGLRLKSQVHLIEPGFHISVSGGHVLKIHNETGKVMADFGLTRAVTGNSKSLRHNPLSNSLSSSNKPATSMFNSNWQTFAQWNDTTNKFITSFSTTWIVPTAPVNNENQVIYIFNGLEEQDEGDIMQPYCNGAATMYLVEIIG